MSSMNITDVHAVVGFVSTRNQPLVDTETVAKAAAVEANRCLQEREIKFDVSSPDNNGELCKKVDNSNDVMWAALPRKQKRLHGIKMCEDGSCPIDGCAYVCKSKKTSTFSMHVSMKHQFIVGNSMYTYTSVARARYIKLLFYCRLRTSAQMTNRSSSSKKNLCFQHHN